MSTFTPMEKLGIFVRADKSQAKGLSDGLGDYPGSESQNQFSSERPPTQATTLASWRSK